MMAITLAAALALAAAPAAPGARGSSPPVSIAADRPLRAGLPQLRDRGRAAGPRSGMADERARGTCLARAEARAGA